jgi:hypothetical protein
VQEDYANLGQYTLQEDEEDDDDDEAEDKWIAKKQEMLKERREKSRKRAREDAYENEEDLSSSSQPCAPGADDSDQETIPAPKELPPKGRKRNSILDSDND